ncbi:unnamed protein product [Calypogeia fissa]
MQYHNALTEEEVFSDRYDTKEVAVNLIETEESPTTAVNQVITRGNWYPHLGILMKQPSNYLMLKMVGTDQQK